MKASLWPPFLFLTLIGIGCAKHTGSQVQTACGPVLPAAFQEEYRLPYEPGLTALVTQGYCGSYGHKGSRRFAYDFSLPMGTRVLAARAGRIIGAYDGSKDSDGGRSNYIKIEHEDGSLAYYAHLKFNSIVIKKGDMVERGDVIALSGNSGNSTGPHLHFEVREASHSLNTIPVAFKDATNTPTGFLQEGSAYQKLDIGTDL